MDVLVYQSQMVKYDFDPEPTIQCVDPDGRPMARTGVGRPTVRDRREDEGRFSRIERDTLRRVASRSSGQRNPVPSTNGYGTGRDRPPRPTHGAGRPRGPG